MKTAKHILGIVMGIIGVIAFIVVVSEPTEECIHPFLTQMGAMGVLVVDIMTAKKVWPEIWKKD